MSPLITLTTDFGAASAYVAAMKGVILTLNRAVPLVDLGHAIPPQDVRHAGYFLRGAVPFFPAGTIHVVVVDPGVGTERAALCVELAGQIILAPDNGCWTLLPGAETARVRRLSEPRFWRQPVSDTFHGRDVFAPAAAHLSLGVAPRELGPEVTAWQRLHEPAPLQTTVGWDGEVVFVDHFGNLITNFPGETLRSLTLPARQEVRVRVGDALVTTCVRAYGDAPAGTTVVLVSSDDRVEIAVVGGNAAQQLQARAGTPVSLRLGDA
jgi:S-adenosylmethionine hydrolase